MDIHASMERILAQQEIVADLFYVVFLDRYPEMREYFRRVDLKHQAVLLTIALKVIEQHYLGKYKATQLYLRSLGTRHHSFGIPEHTFPMFRDALLATLRQFHGAAWNDSVEQQWHEAIDLATETMLEGYQQRYHI